MNMIIKSSLPVFDGFYGSLWDEDVTIFDEEGNELKANAPEWELFNWPEYRDALAIQFVKAFQNSLNESGLNIKAEFTHIQYPKEYNFVNDVVCVNYTLDSTTYAKMVMMVLTTYRETFQNYLNRVFTSRPGFFSFYPNTVREWEKVLQNPVDKLDVPFSTMLEVLIEADVIDFGECEMDEMASQNVYANDFIDYPLFDDSDQLKIDVEV